MFHVKHLEELFVKQKFVCLLLCFTVLFFTACGAESGGQSDDASDETSEHKVSDVASEWIEGLDDADGKYEGETISIISTSKSLFYGDESDPLARAVTKRNALLQRYLELNVSCTEKSADKLAAELEAAINNGTQYADLICAPMSALGKLAAKGLLENIYTLPYLDLDAAYIDDGELTGQTVLNTAYMYSGELTGSINACVGLFYNKAVVEAAGFDPVKLARGGSLTWDALAAMVQAVADGGTRGIDSLLGTEELVAAIYGSSGSALVSAADGEQAACAYDQDVGEATVRIKKELFENAKYSSQYDYDTAAEMFKNGKLGFLVANMSSVSLFDGGGSEWGLLPLPKHSTEQEGYTSFVGSDALAIAVPRGCADSGFSGFALNALLAASSGLINDAFETTYINYHFWSNNAAVMLDDIYKAAVFDIGVIYSSQTAVAGIGITPIVRKNGASPTESAVEEFNGFVKKLFY